MKLSASQKQDAIAACTFAIADAERRKDTVAMWKYRTLRKVFKRSLQQGD